jgi:hypothetical protein
LREKEQQEGADPESDRRKSSGRRDGDEVQVQDGDDVEKDEVPKTQGARKLGMRRFVTQRGILARGLERGLPESLWPGHRVE